MTDMKNWEIKKLGEVYDVRDGTHDSPKYVKEGYALITSKNLKNDNLNYNNVNYITEQDYTNINKRSKVDVGDILFAMIGTIGNPIVIKDEPDFAIKNVALFKVPKNQDSYFLKYYLDSGLVIEQMTKDAKGATQKFVGLGYLRSFPIPLPPLPEQQRIVAILDEAFAAIAKAKNNAKQNLKNAEELFESYLQGVFENPKENWEKKKWGDLCDFVRGPFGGSLKKSIFKNEGYVVYEQKHAIHDHFNQLRYFIDEDKFNEMIRFEVKPGDIIMSCSGVTLGRVAIVPENIQRGIINQALLKLTPKKNVSVHFIKHWLRSNIFQKIIFEYAGGAAIPNVPAAKILKDILIPFPSLKEQNQIVDNIELMLVETKKLEAIYQQKLNDLEELKKSVLQKAFAGELKEKLVTV